MSERHEDSVSVLLADDDDILRKRLAKAFESRGFEVFQATSAQTVMRVAKDHSPEWVLLDLRMPGVVGLELVTSLHGIDPNTNIVVLTGYGSIATAMEAVRLGATHYLSKPVDMDEVLSAFRRHRNESFLSSDPDQTTPSLARVEWEHIQRVLSDCGGNISEAARRLGLHRRSLQRKLSKHPVPR